MGSEKSACGPVELVARGSLSDDCICGDDDCISGDDDCICGDDDCILQ